MDCSLLRANGKPLKVAGFPTGVLVLPGDEARTTSGDKAVFEELYAEFMRAGVPDAI